jgi:hypothetical protein
MITLGKSSPAALKVLGVIFLFSATAAAEIPGLCNTGQTRKNFGGCTGALVTPNPAGGGTQRDGNWEMAYPYPATDAEAQNPCALQYIRTWVDTPFFLWLPNGASSASEWISPYDGESDRPVGSYVYATTFQIPDAQSFTINGQLASDNATVAIYLQTPAAGGACYLVSGQTFPVNPGTNQDNDFEQWWPFTITNTQPLAVEFPAVLFFVVQNQYDPSNADGASPSGLRVEFFSTSKFN